MGEPRSTLTALALTASLTGALCALATACTGGSSAPLAASPTSTATSAATSSSRAQPSPSASPTPMPAASLAAALLPSSCDSVLTVVAVSRELHRAVQPPTYLREKPLPSGRLGRVTCTYAVGRGPHRPSFSATVNLYADRATVAERIGLTLTHDRASGNRISRLTVAGHRGSLDVGPARTSVVLGVDQRVVLLQLDAGVVPPAMSGAAVRRALGNLAAIVVAGRPRPSPSP